jgi:hypothetical protein
MAATYIPIASTTLGTTAASVTFSAIPATYTDLVLRVSARTDTASAIESCYVQFNSDTSTNYSYVLITGNGSAASSNIYSSQNYVGSIPADAATATSNTFASWEVYVPSYLANQKKPLSIIGMQENNQTSAFIRPTAGLWQGTSAITSVSFTPTSGGNFVSGSSFHLYGISNT